MTPEFFRPIRLDAIGEGERTETIAADADERRKLAARFGLQSVDRLDATLRLRREAAGIRVTGELQAAVVQSCSVTGDPLPATLDEPVELLFVPEPDETQDEIELSESACDTMFHDGAAVDIGEAVAETMALALDPFPRSPRADAVLKEAGVLGEGEAGPFAALAALKGKLGG